jgi:hypothetical protein
MANEGTDSPVPSLMLKAKETPQSQLQKHSLCLMESLSQLNIRLPIQPRLSPMQRLQNRRIFPKQAQVNLPVYLSDPIRNEQRPVLQMSGPLRTYLTSQSDLTREVFGRILASRLDLRCKGTLPEILETCDHKITAGVGTFQNEVIKGHLIVLAAMDLEARTILAVTVSLLTVEISIGAQNATIRQETFPTIDWADHHHVIMALQCGTLSVPLGLDQPPSLHVANKARSVSPRNVAWHHQAVKLAHKVRAS